VPGPVGGRGATVSRTFVRTGLHRQLAVLTITAREDRMTHDHDGTSDATRRAAGAGSTLSSRGVRMTEPGNQEASTGCAVRRFSRLAMTSESTSRALQNLHTSWLYVLSTPTNEDFAPRPGEPPL
jgi:hypothetical protein